MCQVPACCGNMLLEHKEVLQGNHNNITKIMFQVYLATVMLSGLQIHSLMIVVSVFIKTQNTLDSCTLPDCTDAEIHDTSLNRFLFLDLSCYLRLHRFGHCEFVATMFGVWIKV